MDLSGPLSADVDHNISLQYNFISQASEWVAARDASISDLDADGRIERLEANLTEGLQGDGIFLDQSVSDCVIDNSSTCHLRCVIAGWVSEGIYGL